MKLLISPNELNNYKSKDKIPLQCYQCNNTFYWPKNQVLCVLNGKVKAKGQFCSRQCRNKSFFSSIKLNCSNCNKEIKKRPSEIKRRKSNRSFCSQSCAGVYNQTHKKHGTNKSSLEKYIKEKLIILYPNLEIHFNQRDTINAELDIYIPSLKLGFELNGIFHYESIFGDNKLQKTQNNDKRKILACAEKGIGLCIIDTTSMSYFKLEKANKFLEIITNLINNSLMEMS